VGDSTGAHVGRLALVGLVALSLAACGGDDDTAAPTTAPATVAPSTAAPATSAPATTPATTPPTTTPATSAPATAPPTTPPTSVAPPTTAPPPTEPPVPTPADLTLLSDGIGPLSFGDPETDVIGRLTAALGTPTSTAATAYPVAVDGVYATDEFGEERFVQPAGSAACFANGLCVYFGGPAAGSLLLTGWSQDDAAAALATPEGITVGSRWSDHLAAMTVDEGGCYSSGSGSTAGIFLWVWSEGTPFLEVLDDGTQVTHLPDPADVVVVSLESGDMPYMPFLDC
jgi:hypothetical protein